MSARKEETWPALVAAPGGGWIDSRAQAHEVRDALERARPHLEALQRAWREVQWGMTGAEYAERNASLRGGGAEAEYVAERARCVGLVDRAARRRRAKRGERVMGAQLAAEARALAWLEGVRAADRAAAADWPLGVRRLLVRLATDKPEDAP